MDLFDKYHIKNSKYRPPNLKKALPNKREILMAVSFKRVREPVSASIRKAVLTRAKNKCEWQGCNERNGEIKLDMHHKDMNNDNNKPKNLMALCKKHHALIHIRNKKISKKD